MLPTTHSFETHDIFIVTLNIKRAAEVSPDYTINVGIAARALWRPDQMLEVGLKLSTNNEDSLSFTAEVVGIFQTTERLNSLDQTERDRFAIDFINERALTMLWAYADGIIRGVTGNMGIRVLKILPSINLPFRFEVDLHVVVPPAGPS